jgi:hypothetical protein
MALVASACVGATAFFGWLAVAERTPAPPAGVRGRMARRRFRPRLVR